MHRHVDTDLNDLKDLLLSMGGCVEKAIDEVHEGITKKSESHLAQVEKQEKLINELHTRVDEECLKFLAMQAPVASDLRLVLAVIKINTDLERMGDQTLNICYNGREFLRSTIEQVPKELDSMKKEVRFMVKSALDAFVRQDVELCKKVLNHDDIVDRYRNQIVDQLKTKLKSDPNNTDAYLNLIMIAKNMERLADHATNIAEDVIFVATGTDIRHGHEQIK
ncbi:MAG: phosphate signaling complex protein PhoU [Bdellovibrionales bacterium]|nr:phosphate signaling complex protein PhoU [Bdellovibrionales bacterium]